jgi:peptide/nickel transport system permease protein
MAAVDIEVLGGGSGPAAGGGSGRSAGAGPNDLGAGATFIERFRRTTTGPISLAFVVFITLFSFVGPLVYRTNQTTTQLLLAGRSPSLAHPLGTDAVGYDVLGRLMVAGRSSLEVGLAVAVIATTFGICWGAVAGYLGGVVDEVLMRVVDCFLSIPPIILLLLLAVTFTPSYLEIILLVSVIGWLGPARIARGEAASLRERDFVEAVRGFGGRSGRVVGRHFVPNIIGVVMVNATFQVADAILAVSALSYLGFGVPPPAVDWGGMLANGLNYLYQGYWWTVYSPGACIVLTVVAFNLLGDGLRDAFDVRQAAEGVATGLGVTRRRNRRSIRRGEELGRGGPGTRA